MRLFLFLWVALSLFAKERDDVDEVIQKVLDSTSILSNRELKIPNYPNAFNPSIIPYKDGYMLSFRAAGRLPAEYANWKRKDYSFIGLALLNKDFEVLFDQLLYIASHREEFSLTAEDARLFEADGKIYIFFNDLPPESIQGIKNGSAMYFSEIHEKGDRFEMKNPALRLKYHRVRTVEKNWTPFCHQGKIYLIYTDSPRTILELELATGYCKEVVSEAKNWPWPFGEVRGGAPALSIDGKFLTIFHSSLAIGKSRGGPRTYFQGAYLFDSEPPFSILAYTPNPIGAFDAYQDNSGKILFPGGAVIEGDLIHVISGKNDRKIVLQSFDKTRLFASFSPARENRSK